jgi:long-chain acyl-CoA synthetase
MTMTAMKQGGSMDRFWLKSYPEGVPADIDFTQYRSLVHLLEEAFRKYPTRSAFTCMDQKLSFAQLDTLSQRLGAWLQSRKLAKGARVAIMMPNILQFPVALAAILRAGYTVVNVNPLYTPRELAHQLSDSGAEAIIILENFATTLEKVVAQTSIKHIVIASMGDLLGSVKGPLINFAVRHVKKMVQPFLLPNAIRFSSALSQASDMALQPVEVKPDDIAFLQYTGGTTGISKGATLLHRNVMANVLQAYAWLRPAMEREPRVDPLIMVCALPLYHIFALTICALLGMHVGAMNLLIPNARDIPSLIKELAKYRFNIFPGVNTLFNGLLNHPDLATLDFSGLKICNGGGMAVQRSVAERWLKATGCAIAEGYGLSETSPVASSNPVVDTQITGTIGLPLPSTEMAILDDSDQRLPIGQIGEIAIRGPQVMAGYWNRPDETRNVMTGDGFFKTGDIGFMDERGYIKIVDRKKDMILVSGFNVYPNEVEDVVSAHPGVIECACIGMPDDCTGEAVKLFVVRRDPALTAEQITSYCKERLTGYKRPKVIEFRSELPKTNVGKILRRELREEKSVA